MNKAIKLMRSGKPIVIFDAEEREGECDLVFLADGITHHGIALLRKAAGGLICTCITSDLANLIGLPFLEDILSFAREKYPIMKDLTGKRLDYDTRSSFSLTINHKDTRTGIPDIERALTIQEIDNLAKHAEHLVKTHVNLKNNHHSISTLFTENFRSPGHVFLLIGAKDLTETRQGHTELSLALASMVTRRAFPVTVICEMLDDQTGRAMTISKAEKWAQRHETIVLNGEDIRIQFKYWMDTNDLSSSFLSHDEEKGRIKQW